MDKGKSRKGIFCLGCLILPLLVFLCAGWILGSIFHFGETTRLPDVPSPDGNHRFSVVYSDSGALGDASTSGTLSTGVGWFSSKSVGVFDTDTWIWEELNPVWLNNNTLELHVPKGVTFEMRKTEVNGVTIRYKEILASRKS